MTQSRTPKMQPIAATEAPAPPGFHVHQTAAAPFQAAPAASRQIIERGILTITLVALGISVLVFLWAVDQFITTWFREQWVPVARGLCSAAIIVGCLYVLKWLVDRRRAV